jgi:hypothetical protein
VHYYVNDVAAVGDYIAVAVRYIPFRYEAPPEDSRSGFFLFDTRTMQIARFESPLSGGSVRWVQEAQPGILVGCGSMTKFDENGFSSALFVYDTREMRTTRLVTVPGRFRGSQYGSWARFERAQDERIYFYLNEGTNTAMYAIDAHDATVKAVGRNPALETGLFGIPPAFAFGPDRIYFAGDRHLLSASFTAIMGDERRKRQD